jgi:predicted DNA-binding transcriptional regulator AlpA
MYFPLIAPDGTEVFPKNPDGSDSRWRWSPDRVEKELWRIEWVKGRNGWSANFRIYADENSTRPPETLWTNAFAGSNRHAKAEAKGYVDGIRPFDTPKPEKLLQRVIHIATNPGDIVLDSFAGSGTTGAVAHKMGRRWIMVEIGDHADTHIVPRLQKVIDGSDQGGISKAVDWKGGGGFRYFTLAPSLLKQDKYGNWVIAQDYNPAMLAEAMCKHMGFTYAPAQDPAEYWRHGHSTETDFIYVTTQALTHDACAKIAHDVGPDRSLLICCKAYDAAADAFEKVGTFARPIGGGEAVPIPSAHWEIDDPLPRFATGTFNAADWANTRAPASHRIFVDTSNFEEWLAQLKPLGPLSNRELEEALNPQLRAARAVAARRVNEARGPEKSQVGPDASLSLSQSLTAGDELLTLHEVEAIVKFKRSSIYNKIKDDGFPESIPLGGKAVWRRSAVMAWVEEKLAQGRRSES